jgi:hypothetical protein
MTRETIRPRRNTRVTCHATAVLSTDAGVFSGVCENLSLGGAFVSCEPAPSDGVVSVILYLPAQGPVEVAGEILRHEARGCGIRFSRLPSRTLNAISSVVATVC